VNWPWTKYSRPRGVFEDRLLDHDGNSHVCQFEVYEIERNGDYCKVGLLSVSGAPRFQIAHMFPKWMLLSKVLWLNSNAITPASTPTGPTGGTSDLQTSEIPAVTQNGDLENG
jgi:hypothetical protein